MEDTKEPSNSNPLKRVHTLLLTAITAAKQLNKTSAATAEMVWANVFGFDETNEIDRGELQKQVCKKLMLLDDEMCKALENFDISDNTLPKKEVERHIKVIRAGIRPLTLSQVWDQLEKQHFTAENLTAIRFASYAISPDQKELPEAEAKKLQKLAQSLRKAIEESESLPEHIRNELLAKVESILLAITAVSLFGIGGVEKATAELVGYMQLNGECRLALVKDKESALNDTAEKNDAKSENSIMTSTGKYLKSYISAYNAVCSFTKNIGFGAEKLQKILDILGS
jgi:hypothetical protein